MVLPLRYTMRAETSDLSFSNMLLLSQNYEKEQLKVCCVWGIGFHPKSTVTACNGIVVCIQHYSIRALSAIRETANLATELHVLYITCYRITRPVWADKISGMDVRMYVCGSLDTEVFLKFRLGLDFDLHMHKMCA